MISLCRHAHPLTARPRPEDAPVPTTCCPESFRALTFADGTRCSRHQTDADRALLADLDRRAPGIGIKADSWPYGPNIDAVSRAELLAWAEHEKVREASSTGSRCALHWLVGTRCTGEARCRQNPPHWMDHVTYWKRDSRPAIVVAQPYGLFDADFADFAAMHAQYGVQVMVYGTGWYRHGTSFVTARPADSGTS